MIFIGEITGAPLIGWLSDQLKSRKLVMILGAIVSFIISTLIFRVTAFSEFTLPYLFFLLGFTLSAQVIGYPLIAEINDPNIKSVASGFCSLVVNMLGAICQILFPLLLTLFMKNGSATAYKTAYLMLPAAFLLSILIATLIKAIPSQSSPAPQAHVSKKINYRVQT